MKAGTYTVKHFQQNTTGDEYTLFESEQISGKAGEETQAAAKAYEHFTAKDFSQTTISADGSTVIKIYYERKKYTVSFYTEKEGALESSEQVKHGAKAIAPPDPTKAGCDFTGWFASSDNGTNLSQSAFDFDTEITGDVALYAKWEGKTISYTVKHLWQNIENDDYTQKESETLSGKFGEQTAATPKTYTGFTAQTISQQTITEDSAIVVEIRYDRNVYTVSFDFKGGSSVASQSVRHGGKASEVNIGTRTGYTFKGWFTSSDGGNTFADTAFNFDSVITSSVNLYENWELKTISYTIKHLWQNIWMTITPKKKAKL